MDIRGVSQTLIESLRDQIVTGQLTPGQRLNENKIASDLKISRSPLREALRVLEREYLVVNIPRKGTYVKEPTPEFLRHLRKIREMLECNALDILEERKIREFPTVERVIQLGLTLQPPNSNDDVSKLSYLRNISSFHSELVNSAGNPWLQDFYRIIETNIIRFQFLALFAPYIERYLFVKQHKHILEMVKMGKYNEAKDVLKNHIRTSFEIVEKKFS